MRASSMKLRVIMIALALCVILGLAGASAAQESAKPFGLVRGLAGARDKQGLRY